MDKKNIQAVNDFLLVVPVKVTRNSSILTVNNSSDREMPYCEVISVGDKVKLGIKKGDYILASSYGKSLFTFVDINSSGNEETTLVYSIKEEFVVGLLKK